MKNKKRVGAFISLICFVASLVPVFAFGTVNAIAVTDFTVLNVTYVGNTGTSHGIKVKFDQRIDNGALDVSNVPDIVSNIKLNGKSFAEINNFENASIMLYIGTNTDKSLLDIYIKNSLPVGYGMNNFVDGKTDVLEFCDGLTFPVGELKNSQKFIRKDAANFYEGMSISKVTSVLYQPDTYDFEIRMNKPMSDSNIGVELQNIGISNYIKINGKTIPEINLDAKDKSGNGITKPVYGYVWDDGTGKNWIMYLHIKKNLSDDRNLKFDGTDTLEILHGFDALQGLKYTVIDTQKRVFLGAFDNYWAYDKESSAQASEVKINSVSAVSASTELTSFSVSFDKNISNIMIPTVNNPLWWLDRRAELYPSVYGLYSDRAFLSKLYNENIIASVRDKILINGKTLYELMLADKGTAYENDNIFVNIGESLNSLTVYVKNTSQAAILCGIVNPETDIVIDIKKDFYTPNNQVLSSDNKFVYRYKYGATFKYEEQPSIDKITTVSLLNFVDTGTAYATQIRFSKSSATALSECAGTYPVKKYIKINGKTIEQINALSAGGVEAYWNDNGKTDGGRDGYFVLHLFLKKTLLKEQGGISLEGNDNIEVLQGFVLPLGGEIKANIKYIYGKSNTWYQEGKEPALEAIHVSSLMNIVVLKDSYALQVRFSKSAATALAECASTYSVKKQIAINGKTIEQINALSAGTVEAYWNDNGKTDGSRDGYFVLHLAVKKSLPKEQGGISLDGNDSVEVLQGFSLPLGGEIKANDKYIFGRSNVWYQDGKDPNLETITVSSLMNIVGLKESYALQIRFSKSAATATTDCTNAYFVKRVKINGKTIEEINAKKANSIQAYWNDNGNAKGVRDGYFVLHLFVNKVLPKIDGGIKLDGKDTVELPNGFEIPNGGSLKAIEKYFYSKFGSWYKDGHAPKSDIVKIERIMSITPLEKTYATQIRFSKSGANILTDCINIPSVNKMVKINGKTIAEINAKNPNYIQAYWNDNGNDKGGRDGYFVLHLFIDKKMSKVDGGIRLDGTDTIEVLKDFVLPNFGVTNINEIFYYKYRDSTWISKGQIDTYFSPVDITGCVGFDAITENHQITIKFDSAVSNGFLPHLNADSGWLKAISSQDNPPFYYSDMQLKSFLENGVQDALRDKILINGKSIWTLMNEDDATRRNVTIICTYGLGGNNSLSISFNDKGTNAIVDTKKYEITFLKGFITPSGGKLEKDVKLFYSPTSRKWTVNKEIEQGNSAEINNVKDASNWVLPKESTNNFFTIIIVGVALIFLAFLSVIVFLRFKKRSLAK